MKNARDPCQGPGAWADVATKKNTISKKRPVKVIPWDSPTAREGLITDLANAGAGWFFRADSMPADEEAAAITRVVRAVVEAARANDREALLELERVARPQLRKREGDIRMERAEAVVLLRHQMKAWLANWPPGRVAEAFVRFVARNGELAAMVDAKLIDHAPFQNSAGIKAVSKVIDRAVQNGKQDPELLIKNGLRALGAKDTPAYAIFNFEDKRGKRHKD